MYRHSTTSHHQLDRCAIGEEDLTGGRLNLAFCFIFFLFW